MSHVTWEFLAAFLWESQVYRLDPSGDPPVICGDGGVEVVELTSPGSLLITWKLLENMSMSTLHETNSSHLEIGHAKRKLVFQPSIFKCYVSFRDGNIEQFSLKSE